MRENMTERFEDLLGDAGLNQDMRPGTLLRSRVVDIDLKKGFVTVDAGLKSEARIPVEQFYDNEGQLSLQKDDWVEVVLEMLEDGFGVTRLSR